jgi:hypothetical protein
MGMHERFIAFNERLKKSVRRRNLCRVLCDLMRCAPRPGPRDDEGALGQVPEADQGTEVGRTLADGSFTADCAARILFGRSWRSTLPVRASVRAASPSRRADKTTAQPSRSSTPTSGAVRRRSRSSCWRISEQRRKGGPLDACASRAEGAWQPAHGPRAEQTRARHRLFARVHRRGRRRLGRPMRTTCNLIRPAIKAARCVRSSGVISQGLA